MGKLTRRMLIGGGATTGLFLGGGFLLCSLKTSESFSFLKRLDVLQDDMIDPIRVGRAARKNFGILALNIQAQRNERILNAVGIECPARRYSELKLVTRDEYKRHDVVLCDNFVVAKTECIAAGLTTVEHLSS